MKFKKFFGVVIISLIVIIVVLFIFFFFKGILDDNKMTNHRMMEIKRINNNLDSYISDFNKNRNTLIFLLGKTYTDQLDLKYDNIVMLLDKEEEQVKNVLDVVSKLDDYCHDKVYSDQSVNQICVDYPVSYESMANVFVGDVQHINGMVSNYLEKHNGNVSPYHTDLFNDYIDYNGDGVYSGKEE